MGWAATDPHQPTKPPSADVLLRKPITARIAVRAPRAATRLLRRREA